MRRIAAGEAKELAHVGGGTHVEVGELAIRDIRGYMEVESDGALPRCGVLLKGPGFG